MPLPPRRWFQFRLSTWFVLVAILAWAMYLWPWTVKVRTDYHKVLPDGIHDIGYFEVPAPDPRLLYPTFALVAFVGWKVGRALFTRWRDKQVHPYLN